MHGLVTLKKLHDEAAEGRKIMEEAGHDTSQYVTGKGTPLPAPVPAEGGCSCGLCKPEADA